MDFLLNTITHWDEPPRARHQVANALSKNHRVVFVEANRVGFPRIVTTETENKLILVSPYFFFGNKIRYRLPVINEIYQRWLFRRLRKTYGSYHVINFDFTARKIFSFFSDVIYYCNDNFSAISKHINPGFVARYHGRCERTVAQKARFCVSVSEILRENLAQYNDQSHEIPLGSPDITPYGIRIRKEPSPGGIIRVGFVGFIKAYNISHELINLLLKEEDMELVLIGPVEEKFLELIEDKDRLTLKGPMTGKELFEEMNTFDVTFAAYAQGLLKDVHVGTGSKMYQYFAVGKPIVISNMVGLSRTVLPQKFIYVAEDEKHFPELIRKAHEENNEKLIDQRVAYANDNTWEKRMEKLIEIYNQ